MLRRDAFGVGSNLFHAHSCPSVVETTCSSTLVLGCQSEKIHTYVHLKSFTRVFIYYVVFKRLQKWSRWEEIRLLLNINLLLYLASSVRRECRTTFGLMTCNYTKLCLTPASKTRKREKNEKHQSFQETSFHFKFCSCCVLLLITPLSPCLTMPIS